MNCHHTMRVRHFMQICQRRLPAWDLCRNIRRSVSHTCCICGRRIPQSKT